MHENTRPMRLSSAESFSPILRLTHLYHAAMANSKPPLPPPAVAYLCELTEEQGKTQDSAGPQVTQDQLVSAFAKMIPPNDTKEVFEEKVKSQHAHHNVL